MLMKQKMPEQAKLGSNRLLNYLSEDYRKQFIDHCELIELRQADILCNPDDTIDHIYFPIEGVISWEKKIAGSPYLVINLIGNEGMMCISLMLNVEMTPCRAVVQKAGFALRISAAEFIHQINHHPALNLLLKRYVYVTFNQLLQTSACHLFHVLEKRLAKLLLMFKDRTQADELHITQELLSEMLGVRRVGVTKAAGSLQRQDLISYSRGNVLIHDVNGLKAASCSCYQADKDTDEQVMHVDIFKPDWQTDGLGTVI